MIDIKEHLLQNADGFWDKAGIQLGIDVPAKYLCRNLQDFLANRDKIKRMDLVLLPRLFYFPQLKDEGNVFDNKMPISLQDESARIDALVRYTAINRGDGKPIVDSLKDLHGGEALYYPILRNGIIMPGSFIQEAQVDDSIYLSGFETFRVHKRKRGFSKVLSRLESLLPDLSWSEPVPVYAK